jgi:PAS domain S-box-containing protein
MKEKIKSVFATLNSWQIMLFSIIGAVLITNLITVLISLGVWHEIQLSLIVLGTINAFFVPLIILPIIFRSLRKIVKLEEQDQINKKTISQLEEQRQIGKSTQRTAAEMSFLYQLGILMASGKDLHETLLTIQREVLKLIQADTLFIAIYDEDTDMVEYPIFFVGGQLENLPSRLLSEKPGLTGPVIYNKETLYLMNFRTEEALHKFEPVSDNDPTLHTFLGIPLMVNGKAIGVLSLQSQKIDAYSQDQILLMENIAVQAALAIDKARLLDQFQKELEERKRVEAGLYEREAILEAITFAAEKLLKTPEWRININAILEHLGKTINATHAYLFEHHLGADEIEYSLLKYEWTAAGYASDFDNPYYQTPTPIRLDEGSPDHSLREGQIFMGNVSTFHPVEKERLLKLGVKAMLEMPLFVSGKWWGIFGFDDLENEREWSNAEVDALKIASGILSAAIQRQKTDAAVQESERIYRQAIEAADAVPYYLDYESGEYLFMGEGIREMTGYSPEEMNAQVWGSIIEENIMLGEAEGLNISDATQLVRQGKLKIWKCDQKIRTRDGQARWLTDRSIELFGDKNMSHGSIGILQDITERKLVEASLRKRESILEAITFSAEQFLKTPDWRGKMDAVLERLGKEFNASHAYLFEKHPGEKGELLNSLKYEWTAPGQKPDINNPVYQNAPMQDKGYERYYQILDSGEPFVGSASFHSETEKNLLLPSGIKALLEMRIVVNGQQWGTIGFDDMVNEREWVAMEVDVIKVASNMLGAAIKRQMDEEALKTELAERKRTEQALIFSEEKFSKAFHTIPVMMSIEDANDIFIDVNKAFMDNMGFDREDIIGRRASDLNILFAPEDVQKAQKILKEQDTFRDIELSFRQKSGNKFTVLMSIEKFYMNNVVYTLTSALDITERKNAEAERERLIADLQAKNAESETLRESTAIVAATLDTSETVQRILDQIKRVVQYDSASVWLYQGEKVIMVGWNGLPVVMETMGEYIRSSDTPDYKFWKEEEKTPYILVENLQDNYPLYRNPPFNYIHGWLGLSLRAHGKLVGFIALDSRQSGKFTKNDVKVALTFAEQVSIALENARLFSDLQNELNERQKLIDELENKNSELEQFTYTVSHDLKSPLVTINGFLGYLERDAESGNMERLRSDTHRIQDAVNKMQRLLNELLELSRIGRMMNASETFSFEELVNEALDILHGRFEGRKIAVQIQPNLPAIYGDRQRLTEVLQNLLDNAAKYMGSQTAPSIEIGQHGEDAGDGKLIFYVKDNGMGIAPEYHERVFGLFNKLDSKSEGTGVGLALVKRIIEVHGGRIWLESEVGKGTTFFFTLARGD